MKSKFLITLLNCKTSESLHEEERFLTFEEAVVYANRTRHKLGMEWKTVSIINSMEEEPDVSTVKKS
tara:strand:+ start:333 stop:533 length:201 start_codon:yes stop_codon:yes gene_type:complete